MASKTAKRAPARKAPAKAEPKSQARTQDSSKLEFTAEATTFPSDPDLDKLEQERAELHKQARVGKADADFIDSDPGYNKDQVAHMREYWGLKDSTATESEEGQLVEEIVE